MLLKNVFEYPFQNLMKSCIKNDFNQIKTKIQKLNVQFENFKIKSENWLETDFEFKQMLTEWNEFHHNSIQDMLKQNLEDLIDNENTFRKFLMIDEIEDRVEDTLNCLLIISQKHSERVDKLIKLREIKVKQTSLQQLRSNVFKSPRSR